VSGDVALRLGRQRSVAFDVLHHQQVVAPVVEFRDGQTSVAEERQHERLHVEWRLAGFGDDRSTVGECDSVDAPDFAAVEFGAVGDRRSERVGDRGRNP